MMKDDVEKVVEGIAALVMLLVTFAVMLAALAWQALVLKILWGWFVVAALGVAPLSYASALGIDIVLATFVVAKPIAKTAKDVTWPERLIRRWWPVLK